MFFFRKTFALNIKGLLMINRYTSVRIHVENIALPVSIYLTLKQKIVQSIPQIYYIFLKTKMKKSFY